MIPAPGRIVGPREIPLAKRTSRIVPQMARISEHVDEGW